MAHFFLGILRPKKSSAGRRKTDELFFCQKMRKKGKKRAFRKVCPLNAFFLVSLSLKEKL
jgi:hypothetical protein